RAREDDAADRLHVGNLGERGRAVPLVNRECERPPDPDVVERLLLVIGRDHITAVPVAALHDDFVAQLLLELIARRGRQAAEFSPRAFGPDGVDANRLLGREDAGEAVEIRLPRMIVVGVAYALDRLADLVARELERAGAHDVLFVPMRILVEDRLLVDPGEGIGQRRQESAGRELRRNTTVAGSGVSSLSTME